MNTVMLRFRGLARMAGAVPRCATAGCVVAGLVLAALPGHAQEAAAPGAVIHTQRASFRPASFADIPGWSRDDMAPAWGPLLRSCQRLARREAWAQICHDAQSASRAPESLRHLFEERFVPMQIGSPEGEFQGGITAYYEPTVLGAREPGDRFSIPIHGVPRDLLLMDGAALATAQTGGVVRLKRNGNELLADTSPAAMPYRIDAAILSELADGSLDRRLRLRLEGDQLKPYFTRGEILARGSLDAPVLAWVADPLQRYAIQVQGAGRIRFADGSGLRIGFAEQNGHPFKPVRLAAQKSAPSGVRVRGAAADAVDEHFDFADSLVGEAEAAVAGARGRTRGLPDNAGGDPDAPREDERQRALRISRLQSDPSYVFFREVGGAADEGPPGALGVALTPERSVAVDPRVTPLGYPMFIASLDAAPGNAAPRRVVLAQDTGGAIRGPLHADLFVGTGHDAGMRAWGTGLRAGMWLLVPKADLPRMMAAAGQEAAGHARTRSAPRDLPECIVADPQYCESGILALPADAGADQSAAPARKNAAQ